MLVLTDVWERLGCCGMRVILVFYATAPVGHGGFGLHTSAASSAPTSG
jgi:dipeptide/tripeptide permease